jgi:chaperonin GroES
MINIRPLHNQIVVKPFPPDDQSAGGIIVPDSFKERSNKATVVAVGRGAKNKVMQFKPSDVVFHIKGAGTAIRFGEDDYYIMLDRDVLAKE